MGSAFSDEMFLKATNNSSGTEQKQGHGTSLGSRVGDTCQRTEGQLVELNLWSDKEVAVWPSGRPRPTGAAAECEMGSAALPCGGAGRQVWDDSQNSGLSFLIHLHGDDESALHDNKHRSPSVFQCSLVLSASTSSWKVQAHACAVLPLICWDISR